MLAPLLAVALGFSGAYAAPARPPLLGRYDLPNGENVARVALQETVRALELPPGAEVPVAVRFFGSSTYLTDPVSGRADWPRLSDVDGVIYIDHAAYREALLRSEPRLSPRELARRQSNAAAEVNLKVSERLHELAGALGREFGALEDVHVTVAPEGFESLKREDGPYEGYHPHEPHFGNPAGVGRLRAIAAELPAQAPGSALVGRYKAIHFDLSSNFRLRPGWLSGDPVKALKRLIQLAVWRGDRPTAARLSELARKPENELLDDYDGLAQIVRSELTRAAPGAQALDRVSRAAARAASGGGNIVTINER